MYPCFFIIHDVLIVVAVPTVGNTKDSIDRGCFPKFWYLMIESLRDE